MIVWRLKRGALVFCCSIFLFYVFNRIALSLEYEEDMVKTKYLKRQLSFDNPGEGPKDISDAKKIPDSAVHRPLLPVPHLVLDIAAVVCGNRLSEVMNMIKSIVIFTKHQIHFHIVSENELQSDLKSKFKSNFPPRARQKFSYTIYNLSYPQDEDEVKWKKLFKVCASQRLFLMNFIKRDRVLYLDTDTIIVSPVEQLWKHFNNFNKSHLAALAPEGEIPSLNWYHRFARHPYYGNLGLNSGVMLMDLKKLREINFVKKIVAIYHQYKLKITWGDQDLLNIFFQQHPELVYVYPCEWNYRPDHCMYQNNCQTALSNGIFVIHGNRRVFHTGKYPTFQVIYDIIKEYQFGENITTAIIERALNTSKHMIDTYCKPMMKNFLKNMVEQTG